MSEQKEITIDQAVDEFKGGGKLLLCEYRFGKAEIVKYRDKVDGKTKEFRTVRHTVEIGDQSFQVSERVPDDFNVETYKAPIAKGARCALRFDRFQVQSGVGQFSGTLVPIVVKPAR